MRNAQLPLALQPIAGVELVRLGPQRDGGYVIAVDSLRATHHIIGFGLGDDWRFEAELQARTGAPVQIYDHTVNPRFWVWQGGRRVFHTLNGNRRRDTALVNWDGGYLRYRQFFAGESREHIKREVGTGHHGTVSVTQALTGGSDADVFLKMDIEGGEWRTLHDIVAAQDRLCGMVIEFHDVDLHLQRLLDFVTNLSEFSIVNVAANNVARVSPDGVPLVVEVSFARRDLLKQHVDLVPPDLNWPNAPHESPISVNYA